MLARVGPSIERRGRPERRPLETSMRHDAIEFLAAAFPAVVFFVGLLIMAAVVEGYEAARRRIRSAGG